MIGIALCWPCRMQGEQEVIGPEGISPLGIFFCKKLTFYPYFCSIRTNVSLGGPEKFYWHIANANTEVEKC